MQLVEQTFFLSMTTPGFSGNMTLTFVECSLHHRSTVNCSSLFPFIVNGGFTPWSNWTECSASCGGGVSSRTRTCTNPIPMFGGVSCADKPVETKECNAQLCPPPKSKLRTRLSLPSGFLFSLYFYFPYSGHVMLFCGTIFLSITTRMRIRSKKNSKRKISLMISRRDDWDNKTQQQCV